MPALSVADLPADSDYHNVQVRKFVEIRALEVFDILSSIFDAVRQTHYADHVGDGWYLVMVAFQDEGGDGSNQTRLQEWFVNSRMFQVGDGDEVVSRLKLKIIEDDGPGGEPEIIRVEMEISQAPTENADGSLADMGEWEIRALFGDSADDFFHATSTVLENGQSRITLEESMTEDEGPGGEMTYKTRALIVRSATEGHGVVEYPDWKQCDGPDSCGSGAPMATVNFAYNENYLTLEPEGGASTSFDRNDDHELVHRYMLFDGTTGDNVDRTRNFGFPVSGPEGQFGWYGAWQDRHELWIDGESATSGLALTREGLPPDETPPTYTAKRFDGALSRIEIAEGSLEQLDGLVSEISIWNDLRLRWNSGTSRWDLCIGWDDSGDCETRTDFTDKLSSLQMPEENDRRWINIGGCNETSPGQWSCTDYVWDSDGFYQAEWDNNGRITSTGVPLTTGGLTDAFELWVGIGGNTYIEYTGEFAGPDTTTGWVEKTLLDFDEKTWTPSFDDALDREFHFDVGRMYFVNQRGSNLRVTRIAENGAAADYQVFMEIHRVAKPVADLTPFIGASDRLVDSWDPDGSSQYALNTDPTSANYLLLEYAVVSERDEGEGASAGDVVEQDMWGLMVLGDQTPMESAVTYNWEYQSDTDQWGGVTYLMQGAQYVLLDEPLRFEAIALARKDDQIKSRPSTDWLSYSLSYDGWLQGVPDPWWELERIGFEGDGIGAALANNVRIPDGTELTSSADQSTYLVKAVDIGIFLGAVTAFPNGPQPDLSLADGVNLDLDLPEFKAPNISDDLPDPAPLLYIEGISIEDDEE